MAKIIVSTSRSIVLSVALQAMLPSRSNNTFSVIVSRLMRPLESAWIACGEHRKRKSSRLRSAGCGGLFQKGKEASSDFVAALSSTAHRGLNRAQSFLDHL